MSYKLPPDAHRFLMQVFRDKFSPPKKPEPTKNPKAPADPTRPPEKNGGRP